MQITFPWEELFEASDCCGHGLAPRAKRGTRGSIFLLAKAHTLQDCEDDTEEINLHRVVGHNSCGRSLSLMMRANQQMQTVYWVTSDLVYQYLDRRKHHKMTLSHCHLACATILWIKAEYPSMNAITFSPCDYPDQVNAPWNVYSHEMNASLNTITVYVAPNWNKKSRCSKYRTCSLYSFTTHSFMIHSYHVYKASAHRAMRMSPHP